MNKKTPSLLLILFVGFTLLLGTEARGQNSFLYTDRQCYVSGDIAFFKVIVKQIQSGDSVNDAVLYVDIVNRDNVFVNGEILKLTKGLTEGYISIPDSVKTGYYSMRVYTYNSIKCTQSKFLATKQLYISNRFGNNEAKYDSDSIFVDSTHNKSVDEVDHMLCLLETNDSVYDKRSKVTMNLQFDEHDFPDTAWAALSVNLVSTCGSILGQKSFSTFETNSSQNNELVNGVQLGSNIHEDKGMIVSGYVNHKITCNPLSNILLLIAFEDSVSRLRYAITDSAGHFNFLLVDCYEKQVVYISAYSYPQLELYPDAAITIDSKFFDQGKMQEQKRQVVGYEQSIDSLNVLKSIIAKTYNITYLKDKHEDTGNYQSFENRYLTGNFNHEVNIDDYVELPDFIQITREILPLVRLRKNEKRYEFSVIDGANSAILENPVVFVDGVPLTDIYTILSWGSDKIKSVQTKSEPRYYGNVGFENGMIFIWTKKMDFWSKVESKNMFIYTIPCFQKPIHFSFPDYSKPCETYQPDFRQILFWEPKVVISKNKILHYEFYTSDETGVYEVVLKGLNNHNKTIYTKKYIQVK